MGDRGLGGRGGVSGGLTHPPPFLARSLPEEVCTVVADAECQTAQAQTCSAVAPAPGCQLVLRQDFNQSGLYCLNVSLANGNGLAMASTRVAVGGGSGAGERAAVVVVVGGGPVGTGGC